MVNKTLMACVNLRQPGMRLKRRRKAAGVHIGENGDEMRRNAKWLCVNVKRALL